MLNSDLIDPNFKASASEVRALRAQRRLAEAASLMQKFIDQFPQDPFWQMECAIQHQIENRFDEAFFILKNLGENNKFAGQLEALLKALDLTLTTKRFKDAAPLIDRLVAWYPDLGEWAKSPTASTLMRARLAHIILTEQPCAHLSLDTLTAPQAAPGFPDAGMIILTKDEADILPHNLAHHYAIGFRYFFIADNQSSDSTAQIVMQFRSSHPDAMVFYYYDAITAHYQAMKMRIFQDLFIKSMQMAKVDLQWMFYVDTDELLCCGDPATSSALRDVMDDPSCEVIVFNWLLCASPAPLASTPRDIHPLRAYPVVKAVYPPATKVALRVGRGTHPTEGNHWMTDFAGPLDSIRLMAEHKWYMFHFMIRSIDQMRSKIINGGRAFQNTTGLENHGSHWKDNYQKWQARGDAYITERVAQYVNDIVNEGVALR